ncbi:uncharacterized protein DNG_07268 [Cephalotrichum gorgonifer]|uniref:Uncharacterized protein n=1 Tax=Cephalotrichum gorgonifer TaxID=2041049 RepID=A0AAE8N3X6_9PEZI|nr:uncharacterized protein DNG_07268 [Cephalotrichum gorgonifer]
MSLLPLGGFQLPFQKRLSRLYNDTKKSSEFVKEPVQNAEDPEMKALHRKLRIQKDRLVTWGVEWSDPNQQSAEIDESLSKAGLSEVVGSVMSTIKDILAEVEPLWQSYKGDPLGGSGGSKDKKMAARAWDSRRFEDLVRDLTASIDTLYDLSRTRSTAMAFRGGGGGATSGKSSGEEVKVYESTRMETPHQIDPSTLTPLAGMHTDSPLDLSRTPERNIVFMSKQAFAELNPTGTWAPLLLEFATFDSIYSTTGIMPPMARFEKLSAGLQCDPQRSPGTWTGLPRLLGYFEDMERSRLGLVYQFPPAFSPVSFPGRTRRAETRFVTLRDLLSRPDYEPRLEAKFRLAHNLANTVFDMHTRGVTHGNLVDGSVAFCTASPSDSGEEGEPDVRRPLVTSFDLFPDTPSDQSSAALHPLFHHPLDPYVTQVSPLAGRSDLRVLDLYSLAMILLSIGMWTSVENLVSDPSNASPMSESVLDKLAIRCGTLYMKAVERCWNAVEDELSGRGTGEEVLVSVQGHVSRCLEACCIVDGVNAFAERARDEEQDVLGRPRDVPSASGERAFKMPGAFVDEHADVNEEEDAGIDEALAVVQLEEQRMATSPTMLFRVPDLPPVEGAQSRAAEIAEKRARLREISERRAARQRSTTGEDSPVTSLLLKAESSTERRAGPAPGLMVQQAKPALPQVSRQVARMGARTARFNPTASPAPQPEAPREAGDALAHAKPVARHHDPYIVSEKAQEVTPVENLPEPKREKMRLYPQVEIPPEAIDKWNKVVMPSINAALRQFYRKHPESVEISLEAIGPSAQATKPTVLVVCTSVGKVKSILNRKMADLFDGSTAEFGLRVCRGKVVRSRGDTVPANVEYQERPGNGASIGAWVGYDHLPPVSFGGLVIVDDRPYGMTVHHMIDDPDSPEQGSPPLRSMAHGYEESDGESESESEGYACEFSDDEDDDEEYSDTEPTSDEEEEEFTEPGDIPGVEPGCGDGYIITQPAFDDVDEGFYPARESAAEDHVDSFGLGTLYASSGIRRREENGLIHEVDWALFEFSGERRPEQNLMPRVGGRGKGKGKGKREKGKGATCPTTIASTDSLPGLEVQCVARTSGAQTGRIHNSLTSVKIYGRTTPSHTYQVSGEGSGDHEGKGGRKLGMPGDSGAWLVDVEGRVCGHVLAWSQRKRVAYICPMDVLLLDIAERLGACEVRLPGGEAVVSLDASWEGLVGGVERLAVEEWAGRGVARSRAAAVERSAPATTEAQGGEKAVESVGAGEVRDVEVGVGVDLPMSYLSEKVEEKSVAGCPVVCVETAG